MKTIIASLLLWSATLASAYDSLPGSGSSSNPYRVGTVGSTQLSAPGLGYNRVRVYYQFSLGATAAADAALGIAFSPIYQGGYNLDLYQSDYHIGTTSYLNGGVLFSGYRVDVDATTSWAVLPLAGLPAGTYKVAVSRSNDTGYSTDYLLAFSFPATGGTVSLSPTSASVGSASTSGNISVQVTGSTQWTAVSNASWLQITTPTGTVTGSGTVHYRVSQNSSSTSRSGSIVVAGKAFTITQSGQGGGGDGNVGTGGNAKPVVMTAALPSVSVAQNVTIALSASNGPTKFSAAGLPPGVKIAPATGVISGRPTAARRVRGVVAPYNVTIRAYNASGVSEPSVLQWQVEPLNSQAVGTFTGLVDPNPALNGVPGSTHGFGGALTVTSSASGSISGRLRLGASSLPFKGSLNLASPTSNPTASVVLRRRAPLTDLTLEFTLDPSSGTLTGTLSDGATTDDVTALRMQPSPELVGSYNVGLFVDADDSTARPSGTGYAMIKVNATGRVSWSGKLADGTAITVSSAMGVQGWTPLFRLLYGNTGSVWGWVNMGDAGGWVYGVLDWLKNPQARPTTNYPQGFVEQLVVYGGRYSKPGTGAPLLNLGSSGQVDCFEGGLSGSISAGFSLSPTHVAAMPTNAHGMKLSLNASTGLFAGRFTVPGSTPGASPRQVSFAGALVPGFDAISGVGYFRLKQGAGKNDPILSGEVVVR